MSSPAIPVHFERSRSRAPAPPVEGRGCEPLVVPAMRLRPSRLFWRANGVVAGRALDAALNRRLGAPEHNVVAHGHFYAGCYHLRTLKKVGRVPYVVSEHSSALTTSNPEKSIDSAGERRAAYVYEAAAAVLPVSQSLADAMSARGLPLPGLQVVHNPVDTNLFAPDANERGRRVVTAARLEPVKQLDVLLESMRGVMAADSDVTLDIAGSGSELPQLRRLAAELGIDGRVTFHGRLDRAAVAALLRRCSVFVLTSHTENMPVAAIEAAACGLPIVAPAVGGIPELLGLVHGTLFDSGDSDGLTQAIMDNLDIGEDDRMRTRQAAVQHFSIEAIGHKLGDIYSRAVGIEA